MAFDEVERSLDHPLTDRLLIGAALFCGVMLIVCSVAVFG